MDTSLKNANQSEPENEPGDPARAATVKEEGGKKNPRSAYPFCKRSVRFIAFLFTFISAGLLVLGGLNADKAFAVLDGELTPSYHHSFESNYNLTFGANRLAQYRSAKASGNEEELAWAAAQLADQDGPMYLYCTVGADGAMAEGNAAVAEITKLPVYAVCYEGGAYSIVDQGTTDSGAQLAPEPPVDEAGMPLAPVGYVGIPASYVAARNAARAVDFASGYRSVWLLAGGALLLALATAYFIVTAGRRVGEAGVSLQWWDWVYLDVQAVSVFFLACGGIYLAVALGVTLRTQEASHFMSDAVMVALIYLLCLATALLCLGFLTSLARRIKRREFLRHTLCGAAFLLLWKWVKLGFRVVWDALRGLNAAPLQILMVSAFFLGLVILWLSMPGGFITFLLCVLLGAAVLGYLYTEGKIAKGVRAMREGQLTARIAKPRLCSILQQSMIDDMNNLASGMEEAVREQVKAQSMKTELITNVSHDLKTPLTSILAYVELLKQAQLDPPAGEYVEVLSQKSQRLKRLTEDLFEAAKAASGNIPLTLAPVDLCQLLTQGVGELEDRIAASNLDWRLNLPGEPLWVIADGRYLWRVIENLCSNTLKYALPGSRVYLEANPSKEGGYGVITLKNISREPLNISADELTERFVRGDSARATEGSGLGLSIAKSLTEQMRGRFTLTIDGDLFKAMVEIPLSPIPASGEKVSKI